MNRTDEKKFAVFMAMLGTAFERGELTTPKIQMYFEYLSDLDIQSVERATHEILRSRKFPSFPTIAEIREAALGSDEAAGDEGLLAWGRLLRFGRRAGKEDSRIDRTVKMGWGSWEHWEESDPKMDVSNRQYFAACWKVVARQDRAARALAGGAEAKQLSQGVRQ